MTATDLGVDPSPQLIASQGSLRSGGPNIVQPGAVAELLRSPLLQHWQIIGGSVGEMVPVVPLQPAHAPAGVGFFEDWLAARPAAVHGASESAFDVTFAASITATIEMTARAAQATVFELAEPLMALRATFDELASVWKRETAMMAFVPQKAMHWAYQQIIGMGRPAVPLILLRLRDAGPDHWFWALAMITREDAAAGAGSLREATDRWLAWGHERSLV
jgi:hypothetical protein